MTVDQREASKKVGWSKKLDRARRGIFGYAGAVPWWGMSQFFPTLDAHTQHADCLEAVRKNDLVNGDAVLVRTKNSVYEILALGNGFYQVSGGWFDRHGVSGQVVTINGCTWGGSAIKQDIIAARGLFLEFGNRVVTTRIRDILLIRGDANAGSPGSGTDSTTVTGTQAMPNQQVN